MVIIGVITHNKRPEAGQGLQLNGQMIRRKRIHYGLLSSQFTKLTMPETFFYVAKKDHQPGDLLGAGHFGQGYRQYPYDINTREGAFNGWKIAKEMIFENIRSRHYPSLPSRLECSYAYLTRADALSGFQPGQGLFVFEVIPVDPLAPSHIGDFLLLSSTNVPAATDTFIPWAESAAHSYWSGHSPQLPELLTLSPLRVVQRIG